MDDGLGELLPMQVNAQNEIYLSFRIFVSVPDLSMDAICDSECNRH